jgi:hypothetical protein
VSFVNILFSILYIFKGSPFLAKILTSFGKSLFFWQNI